MDGIFISYRRDDSAGYAGRLYDRLAGHFGAQRVFMDVEGIEPGVDFVTAIEEAVSSCRVLIVIIGDEWTQAKDAAGRRRLDDPNDFIRLETGTALQRGIRVVPVLVEGASMPHIDDLPDDLKSLTRRQAIEISHKQWESSTGELIRTLEGLLANTPMPAIPVVKPEPSDKSDFGKKEIADGKRRHWLLPTVALGAIVLAVALWSIVNRGERRAEPLATRDAPAVAVAKPAPEAKPKTDQEVKPVPEPTVVAVPDSPDVGASQVDTRSPAPFVSPPVPVTAPITAPVVVPAAALAIAPAISPVAAPVIRSFKAEAGVATGVTRLCYRVSNADRVSLSPRPGALAKTDADCVDVALEEKATFILSAENGAKTVRKTLLVTPKTPQVAVLAAIEKPAAEIVPAADPKSAAATSSILLVKGERWTYRSHGKWATSPKLNFEVVVQAVSGALVTDSLRAIDPNSAFSNQERQFNGKQAAFVGWTGIGFEFSPYFSVFSDLAHQESLSNLPTPDLDSRWDRWYSSAKVLGQESVSVPAGTFDAFKVEVWSNRHATGSPIEADVEPVRVHFLIWYAAPAKRYVKMQRQISSANNRELEHDVFELVQHH